MLDTLEQMWLRLAEFGCIYLIRTLDSLASKFVALSEKFKA